MRASTIKRVLPRTLFGRALLIIVMPLILLQIVTTWIFYDRHWDVMSRRLSHGVAGDVAMVIDILAAHPSEAAHQTTLRLAAKSMDLYANLHVGATLDGDSAEREPGSMLSRTLARALDERVRRPYVLTVGAHPRNLTIKVQLAEGVLEVIVSRERLFSSTTYIFVMWMVGSSLVLFAVASLFMRNQIRPLRRLAAAVDAFGKGRDTGDFKPVGATEVRLAAIAFERMRARIGRQIQQRTDMLSGVSHDLRTPLTRMKLQLALLDETPDMADLKTDVDEMERMLDGYLAFARGEGGEQPEPTDLGRLLDEVVAGARRQGADVGLEQDARLELPLRANAVKRCLDNLVANAARYGRHVRVAAHRNGQAIDIVIDDDGPGIPPARRADVFRPFFRLENSRNPATGGVGLGLSIARDVVASHGGEIGLHDSPLGGLRVRVRLPL
ncbi:MAG: HAMP domain-containing protein [Alphaproteobacteria bacterium]|nr:HAMP domain-containing protein [Alphaproteobacteria bacterium]